jgi:hypothetical protein
MTIDYDPISSLEAVGYLEREASFLYLVAVHSGYFLRRQYSRFAGRDGGTLIARFLKKADRLHHIKVIECGQGWHIYHLASQSLYAAIERPDSQNRRIKGDAYIKSRLMVLDFVLAHLSANILEDEASKVDFFTTQCGVRSELLPRSHARRLMYFPDGFPILVSNTGTPRFIFSMRDRRQPLVSSAISNSTSLCLRRSVTSSWSLLLTMRATPRGRRRPSAASFRRTDCAA